MGSRIWFILLCNVFLPAALLGSRVSAAGSLITANRSLSGEQAIVSSGVGDFELGFFSPTKTGKPRFYVGIWYARISLPEKTVVWVANRESPVSDPAAAELVISGDGNLVLLDESKTLIWSTNSTTGGAAAVAELIDGGNLVLRDAANSSRVFWQSVDHPTDTWLPGGKVGLNKVTGENQRLVSWRSSDDPSPGIFSLELVPGGDGKYFLYWNRSRDYWSSGPWKDGIFSLVPEMTLNYVYDFKYVNNKKENYFTYSIKPHSKVISRFVVNVSGQIQQFTWFESDQQWFLFWAQPRRRCDVHMYCGEFSVCNDGIMPYCGCLEGFGEASPEDWSSGDRTGGCRRRTPLGCVAGAGEDDGFHPTINVDLPENGRGVPAASAGECGAACLENCSCTGYAFNGSCSVWHGGLRNLRQRDDDGGATFFLRLASSELPGRNFRKKKIIVGVVSAAAAALAGALAIIAAIFCHRRRRRFKALKAADGGLVAFRYEDLRRATKNFSQKLGGGGFGSVFLGITPDSAMVAVKKLEGTNQGEKQFRAEVRTIGTIQHVNLVRLLGFCSQGPSKRLLVYEFMQRGSLDRALFTEGDSSSPLMDWRERYMIILGIARGLAYLHESCRDCIIHCDIKPENILLDGDLVPKVADFGMAKLVGRDFSRVLTTMRGTRGYLAPEWISGEAITAKADVFSFGMMLFEIISGRRNSDGGGEGYVFFPAWALRKMEEGEVGEVLDRRLREDANAEEVQRAMRTAFWCIQEEERSRPTMNQVVKMLEGMVEVSMPPAPRSLWVLGEGAEKVAFFCRERGNPSSASTARSSGGLCGWSPSETADSTTVSD